MDHSFDHSVFSKNKQRPLASGVAREFLLALVEPARVQRLLSVEHFSVDGTLLDAWASMKSFRPNDEDPPPGEGERNPGRNLGRNPEVNLCGEQRSNDANRSATDPESRLAGKGKGKEARLCFGVHLLMDNREGLVADLRLTPAGGTSERDATLEMLASVLGEREITVGADRGYDTRGFVTQCRYMRVTPDVAQKRRSAIDRRTTRHESYRISQRTRKRIEEVFGCVKTVAGGRKLRYCGVARNRMWAELTVAGYNLVRLAKLTAAAQAGGLLRPGRRQPYQTIPETPPFQPQPAQACGNRTSILRLAKPFDDTPPLECPISTSC